MSSCNVKVSRSTKGNPGNHMIYRRVPTGNLLTRPLPIIPRLRGMRHRGIEGFGEGGSCYY